MSATAVWCQCLVIPPEIETKSGTFTSYTASFGQKLNTGIAYLLLEIQAAQQNAIHEGETFDLSPTTYSNKTDFFNNLKDTEVTVTLYVYPEPRIKIEQSKDEKVNGIIVGVQNK